MVAKVGMKRKAKDGDTEKEGVKEAEDEFQTAYKEVETEVAELVSFCVLFGTGGKLIVGR